MDQESICKRIRELRIEKGFSQKYIGEKCGLTQQAINRIEHGLRKIDIDLLRKIALALDVYTYDLLYDEKTSSEKKQQELIEIATNFIGDGLLEFPDNATVANELLLNSFNKLNKKGKVEAVKRVAELTEIPRYTNSQDN